MEATEAINKLDLFLINIKQSILKYHRTNNKQILMPLCQYRSCFNMQTLSFQLIADKQIDLNSNNIHFITRILQIVAICRHNLEQSKVITKRNLFYQLQKYYKDYATLDYDLLMLCQNLQVQRKQLGIIASNRCVLFGQFTLLADSTLQRTIENPHDILTIPTCSELSITQIKSRKVLLIQKQSMFYSISRYFKQQNISEYLLVTAKGYPDLMTRELLVSLLPKIDVIYYLGDYDVYGFDIFCFYTFGDWKCKGLLSKIWLLKLKTHENQIFNKQQLSKQYSSFSQDDLKKIEAIKNKQIFNIPLNPSTKQYDKIKCFKQYFDDFSKGNQKAELEHFEKQALSKHWIRELLVLQQQYLLNKVFSN